ncbi:unnamed protein product [Mytilus edulis]|uniref:Uncharacterized protein n=1 Tax=Mytilus edulis TaxID=6550 RepID=A0A8S3SP34_MYTED|nr:unnamed protein product [Mytilus edulis]
MGDSTMEHVLQDLNLKAYTKTFIVEKKPPDIVCKLSSHEMEALVVSSRADMMRLRTECVKYGNDKPQRVRSQCGPPNFDITKSILENVLVNGCGNPVGLDGAANLQNYGVEGFVDQNDVEDGERPIFASLAYLINEQCRDIIAQEFIRNGNNFGIDDFLRCLEIVERYN